MNKINKKCIWKIGSKWKYVVDGICVEIICSSETICSTN